jgi:putative hydrolase of the HAD superfamily
MIRAVFFDLDGTLYDRDLLVRDLVKEQFAVFQESLRDVGDTLFAQRIIELDAHGDGNKPELYARVVEEWDLAPELAGRLLRHFWESYPRHCKLSEDTSTTLHTLRRNGQKLGVITNGTTEWQQQKLGSLGLATFFDTVLISEREGVRKPDRVIFARALERCEVRPHEAVFVGDHPEVDVAGAQAAGLVPVWRRVPYREMTVKGVLSVDTLAEILPICLNLEKEPS